MSESLDRRQRYTQMVIKQTLLDLMTTKPIEKITVSELCTKAEINRGTFYLHYEDIYVLLATVEDEISRDIKQSLAKMTSLNQQDMLRAICNYIKTNALFARAYFSEHGHKEFIRKIMNTAQDYFRQEYLRLNPRLDRHNLDYMYTFYVHGIMGILQHWTQSNFQDSPDLIAKLINQLDAGLKKSLINL